VNVKLGDELTVRKGKWHHSQPLETERPAPQNKPCIEKEWTTGIKMQKC